MKKIAVITGASSGLGREFALQIARHYKTVQEIWIIARRTDRLDNLKKEIKEISDKTVRVLTLDLSKQSDIDFYKKLLERQHAGIRVLVNADAFEARKTSEGKQEKAGKALPKVSEDKVR